MAAHKPQRRRRRALWRHYGLSIVLFVLFAVSLAGQSLFGWHHENSERLTHDRPSIAYVDYLRSGGFLEVTMENWESEFLQMFAFVVLTIFLFQKGSAESRDPDASQETERPVTAESPAVVRAGGWRLRLYENSMSLAFLVLFLMSLVLHAVGGHLHSNEERLAHGEPAISLLEYATTSRFWFESLQNWQSEFLSIWAMVVLSIFLRQKGSPESKPVASAHSETGR